MGQKIGSQRSPYITKRTLQVGERDGEIISMHLGELQLSQMIFQEGDRQAWACAVTEGGSTGVDRGGRVFPVNNLGCFKALNLFKRNRKQRMLPDGEGIRGLQLNVCHCE